MTCTNYVSAQPRLIPYQAYIRDIDAEATPDPSAGRFLAELV